MDARHGIFPAPLLLNYIMSMHLTNTEFYYYVSSSNGLIWIDVTSSSDRSYKSLVGNPVTQQWVEIPPPPYQCMPNGLVTRVEEDGVVSSFKLICTCLEARCIDKETNMYTWVAYVFSSETWQWTTKRLFSHHPIIYIAAFDPHLNLNGMLYQLQGKGNYTVLIAHDFYGPETDDQCQVIPLPGLNNKDVLRCLTTSKGDVICIEVVDRMLKVWTLNNNAESSESGWWELSREINMASVGFDVDCYPMAMNPFDSDIVYLLTRQHCFMVSGNLRTREFIVYPESEAWSSSACCSRLNPSDLTWLMGAPRGAPLCTLPQFVPWIDSVPRPPN